MSRFSKTSVFGFALVLLVSSAVPGQVRTWVSPDGLDTNPCTLQSPCRNFAAAITAVAAAGEVVALSSGGFGPVTINKSVSLIAPEGVHAAIAPTSGAAVTVTAGNLDRVVLRNLYLNAQGADDGVLISSGLETYLEGLVASGFSQAGVRFTTATSDAKLLISDTTIRMCNAFGVRINAAPGAQVSLNTVRLFHGAGTGVSATGGDVKIQRSLASGYSVAGFSSGLGTTMVIDDTTSSGNPAPGIGFYALIGVLSCNRCVSSGNGVGVRAFGSSARAYIARSTIVGNAEGVTTGPGAPSTPGEVLSRGDNTLEENTAANAFTGPYTPQ